MSRSDATDKVDGPPVAPQMDQLVERLRQAIEAAGDADTQQRRLLEEALAEAAQTQRQLAKQQARIAYLESLSATDELTRLLNRRGFYDEFARTLARADRYGERGVLLLVDFDGLKGINDSLGHLAGDRVLHFTAGLLSASVRRTDYVARLGGDEFVVVLTNTTVKQGRNRAAAIEQLINSATVPWKRAQIQLRASVGLAPFDSRANVDELLHRADKALYEKKTQGASRAAV
ncbi:MAG: GGDEF domain-containing protein [Kiloniellales bacterium]